MQTKHKIILFIPITILLSIGVKLLLPTPLTNVPHREYCWVKKTHDSRKVNIAVIGDSRIYRGVNPDKLIDEENDLEVRNYGYSSSGYSQEYLDFISAKLTSDGERVVVCGITPYSFTPNALENEHFHTYLELRKKEVIKTLYLSGIMKYFPSYSPSEVYDNIKNDSVVEGYFSQYMSNGWVKSYKTDEDHAPTLIAYRKNFNNNSVSHAAVENFIYWAKVKNEEGVKVLSFRPPSSLAMEQLEDSLSGLNYVQFQEDFEEIGGVWLTYPSEDYHSYDGSHLEFNSANQLSEDIKQDIDAILVSEE